MDEAKKEFDRLIEEYSILDSASQKSERDKKEIRKELARVQREMHRIQANEGIKPEYDDDRAVMKGLFRIVRLPEFRSQKTSAHLSLKVESDMWSREMSLEGLVLELNRFNSGKELKKQIDKMIKDLEWLKDNIPLQWSNGK